MVANVFDTLLVKGVRAGQIPARTQQSRTWFRTEASKTSITPSRLMSENSNKQTNVLVPGQMILYNYDPKHKKTLPYYDRFPLCFPFKKLPDGFLGLNMHYLPLRLRAKLMDGLYDTVTNQRFDENTKLNISYNILSKAANFKGFKPTVHRYLNNHVKSRFLIIDSVEWDIALFLPLQRFAKASDRKVWADSRKSM